MSEENAERFESDTEFALYREYRDVLPLFKYVVETERRFYLANEVNVSPREIGGGIHFEIELSDAWVWDLYRPGRFVKHVKVMTFSDVNIEELDHPDRI